uniref:Uncharacterized protein n=1 Tax=Magallana gigas TaxID=29159 RepID=A0A8W8L3W6_MAGGI
MNSCHLFAVICLCGIFICSQCDQTAQDRIEVEGSGEVLTHTGKVPVVDDELMTTRVPGTNNKQTTRDSVKFTNEEVLTKDNKVSGSDNSKKTASTDIVFIIAPAVVGTVALIAVVIAIVFIRRKGE